MPCNSDRSDTIALFYPTAFPPEDYPVANERTQSVLRQYRRGKNVRHTVANFITPIFVIASSHTEMVTGEEVPPFGLRTTTVCVDGEINISRTLKLPGVLFAFFVTTHKSPFASRVNV